MWRGSGIAYVVTVVVLGIWLIFQINSSPGAAGSAEVAFAILTWGLSRLVWFACMWSAFTFLAFSGGAGGDILPLLAGSLVLAPLAIAQLAVIRFAVRSIGAGSKRTARDDSPQGVDQ